MRITDARLNEFTKTTALGTAVTGKSWRTQYFRASFRGVFFFVEASNEGGGRRVALHEYPKRNTPYAEDMGRSARTFQVQGYLIGRQYHLDKDKLVAALEEDGPGMLRLPMMYLRQDINVMVQGYTVAEARERGGFCAVTMTFCEYGNPRFRTTVNTAAEIDKLATNLDNVLAKFAEGKTREQIIEDLSPYTSVFTDMGGAGGIGSDATLGGKFTTGGEF